MYGGPLYTRLSAWNVVGKKNKKKNKNTRHGIGVSEEEDVLELLYNSVSFVCLFFLYNATRQHLPRQCFPKSVCLCLWEGWPNETHTTPNNSFPDSRALLQKPPAACLLTSKRRPPRHVLNATNKNAASKRPGQCHHRYQ